MDRIGIDYTSYKDMKGVISIDFPGGTLDDDLPHYANSLGIDIERYRPFGIEIVGLELGDRLLTGAEVRILAYDTGSGKMVVRFANADTLGNFLKRVHRLSITITTDHFTEDQNIELSSEIDLANYGEEGN